MTTEDLLGWTREDFPALRSREQGQEIVYFDNACNTLVPQQVVDAITDYYVNFPACGSGRSRHRLAREVTDRIEGNPETGVLGSRNAIRKFINAESEREVIFALNSSHGINTVALGQQFKKGDVVLISDKEHNSNLIPWLRLRKLGLIDVKHVPSDGGGTIDLNALEAALRSCRVKLVSVAWTSNLTGATLPAKELVSLAHRYGARVLLDAAQTAPHQAVDVRALDVDFMVFSIHKMCGPRGVGILYGKRELLGSKRHEEDESEDVIRPVMLGGETIEDATFEEYSLLPPPMRFEVGLQDYPGQIGAGTAVEYLNRIGMDNIAAKERLLNGFLTAQLFERYGDRDWFSIMGPGDAAKRGGILTFEVKRPNPVGIAEELSDRANVMIRDGFFCVHSYLNWRFGQGWTRPRLPSEQKMTYRVSLYFYNTVEECRIFLEALNAVFKERGYLQAG